MIDSMKTRLRASLVNLPPDVREFVIDQVLGMLSAATPFMIEQGAHALNGEHDCTSQALVERVWAAMINEAREGG